MGQHCWYLWSCLKTSNISAKTEVIFIAGYISVEYHRSRPQSLALLNPIQSNNIMHHCECIALCRDISLQRGRFCARSLTSCIRRSSKVLSSWMFFIHVVPSVLWRCWLGGRNGIRPVKNWVVRCWRGYLSGARCRLAYGPADATATYCLLLQQNPDWFYLSGTGSPR